MKARHLLVAITACVAVIVLPTAAAGAHSARVAQDPATTEQTTTTSSTSSTSSTSTTEVNAEEEIVDPIEEGFEADGDGTEVLSIVALVAGLLGMLMGGVALARTTRSR